MITIKTAEDALKTVYLGVIGDQLNLHSNPLLSKIKHTSNGVYGNEIVKTVSYGISGGVTASPEADELPGSYGKNYVQFKSTLKNLYGTIEISDKALRCSQNSAGAFVNLLNDEMESLIKSSNFNLGRMLYGDGSGILGTFAGTNEIGSSELVIDSLKFLAPNMAFRVVLSNGNAYGAFDPMVIKHMDRTTNTIYIDRYADKDFNGYKLATLRGLNSEITGLGSIFNSTYLYGLKRENHKWLNPYTKTGVGELSEVAIQGAIDEVEFASGEPIDFISCSAGVRRAYQECLSSMRRNVDVLNLDGGFRALSYNGIPLVVDRFVNDDEMLLLNTKEFEICQLGDWQWLEGNDGKIIKQKDNYPVYTATLVKYAELFCNRPNSIAKLSGITVA